MKNSHELEDYALNLGKLVSTLQSLEYCLRAFLFEDDACKSGNTQKIIKYNELKVTDRVPENAFTNYDSLGKLIEKYNKIVLPIGPELAVSKSVVVIRDALAHGRVASFSLLGNMHLLKFSTAQNNQVEVLFSAELNAAWFKNQINHAGGEIIKVVSAERRVGMQIFGEQ
jgi:hypothetical protein